MSLITADFGLLQQPACITLVTVFMNESKKAMSLISYMQVTEKRRRIHPPVGRTQALAAFDDDASTAAAGRTIEKYITSQHHSVSGLSVKLDLATKTIVLRGTVRARAICMKVVQCCRHVIGVAKIEDHLVLIEPESLESQYRAVKPGVRHSAAAMGAHRNS